jgi:ABC-type branched-subunit amino acid transport system substrate-binding protein
MYIRNILFFLGILLTAAALSFCTPPKSSKPGSGGTGTKPTNKPRNEQMDTVRWGKPANPKPPVGPSGNTGGNTGNTGLPGQTYRIAYVLPFLSGQFDGTTIPEKSRYALQFYSGAKLALQKISEQGGVNLVVDIYDANASDADFQKLLNDSRLRKASVFIGPVRSTHVSAMANWAKTNRKIVLSPESPNSDLTTQNPDFVQVNPSLQAHCAAITRYVLKNHRNPAVTLVCKQKEAERLAYFHAANPETARFTEWILPDETTSFTNQNLSSYIKAGRTNVFIMPSWSSQDFVNAFLRQLKAVKGNNRVEVYGMPQWAAYESIEPEFFRDLNVHISAASYVQYNHPEVKAFQQAFYESTGTIPDEDAFAGYDLTLYTGNLLRMHGLSFPQRLSEEDFTGLHARYWFIKIFSGGKTDDGTQKMDYWENSFVHILKYGATGFAPPVD